MRPDLPTHYKVVHQHMPLSATDFHTFTDEFRNRLLDAYRERLQGTSLDTFNRARSYVDDLAAELEPSQLGGAQAEFARHLALLHELRNLALVVAKDAWTEATHRSGRAPDAPVDSATRSYRSVFTTHPTHSRTATMRSAYRDTRSLFEGYVQARSRGEPTDAITLPASTALDALLPPSTLDDWQKPSLARDEIPMVAQAVASHARGMYRLLLGSRENEAATGGSTQASRDLMQAQVEAPGVWGAYDQDGHPDAYPGAMLLQRAHLRHAMWSVYHDALRELGMESDKLARVTATRDHWSDVVRYFQSPPNGVGRRPMAALLKAQFVKTADAPEARERLLAHPNFAQFFSHDDCPCKGSSALGEGRSAASEQDALLALMGDEPRYEDLRAVVAKYGTRGAVGDYRFTSTAVLPAGAQITDKTRGVWIRQEGQEDYELNQSQWFDLLLALKEVQALDSDVGRVILSEFESGEHLQATIRAMRHLGVLSWLDRSDGVVVMPLLETGGTSEEFARTAREMLGSLAPDKRPKELHVMLAGSDLVNREGSAGQMLEQFKVVRELIRLQQEFPEVAIRIMEGVGGSTARTRGPDVLVKLRSQLRVVPPALGTGVRMCEATSQGIQLDRGFITPMAAAARLVNMGERVREGIAPDELGRIIEFLQAFQQGVARHDSRSLRDHPDYLVLFRGNPLIDAMKPWYGGSRTAAKGTPFKGLGAEGERTITAVNMWNQVGRWDQNWQHVPQAQLDDLAGHYDASAHGARADTSMRRLAVLMVTQAALELSLGDPWVTEQVLGYPDSKKITAERCAVLNFMREGREHMAEFLQARGVLRYEPDSKLWMPVEGTPVFEAMKSSLGLPSGSDLRTVRSEMLKRRAEGRAFVGLCESALALPLGPQRDAALHAAHTLAYAQQRREAFTGVGASDIEPGLLHEKFGLLERTLTERPLTTEGLTQRLGYERSLHGISFALAAPGQRSELSPGAPISISVRDFSLLGPRLFAHEAFHWHDDVQKAQFRQGFGDAYAGPRQRRREMLSSVSDGSVHLMRSWVDEVRTNPEGLQSSHAAAFQRERALREWGIAFEQIKMGRAKLAALDRLGKERPRDPHLQAEQARQREKLALATLSARTIHALSKPSSRWGARLRTQARNPGLSNEARFLLFNISGGLLGVPSHYQSGKVTAESRAYLSQLPEHEAKRLGLQGLWRQHQQSAKARRSAAPSDGKPLPPGHRRFQARSARL